MASKVRRETPAPAEKAGSALNEYRRKRDFARTPEPEGRDRQTPGAELEFVVQRHAARTLHYDLRLELDGVMKSWAVPKGPCLDPDVKRLAVEVEDHPMEYNTFEGIIPEGEYGGGTVMIWDRGTFSIDGTTGREDSGRAMRKGLRAGKLSVNFHGERLRGSFHLVRTGRRDNEKPQWLLIKQDDGFADPSRDLGAEAATSVATGRTMDEIAAGKGGRRVWRRDGEVASGNATQKGGSGTRQARHTNQFSPMLATPAREPPQGDGWVFEPKWDGIRVLAFATPDGVALLTRNNNEKQRQFPEVADALRAVTRQLDRAVVLDGEVVAVRDGHILRFEALQGRMHVENAASIRRLAEEEPATLVAFDLLVDGEEVLVHEPWTRRRERLEALFREAGATPLILGETDSRRERLQRRAAKEGWEGLVAKRAEAAYQPGRRSTDWLKLKLENRQEFVVGGWTEPRNARKHIGALLLGYYDGSGTLRYAGHTGTGLSHAELGNLHRRLQRLERKTSPFSETPKTNERPHWTTPRLVVEIRFNEWTAKGLLRQPVYVGMRDDKPPKDVVREPAADERAAPRPSTPLPDASAEPTAPGKASPSKVSLRAVEQLSRIEAEGGGGTVRLRARARVDVTSLDKRFFPKIRKTKGDLLRYYATMADHILPFMRDRPLVLKRFPDGEGGKSFYQQNAPESVPDGVRVEVLRDAEGLEQRRFVGGDLVTLLYTIQLGAISYDPWHSRCRSLEFADYTILDLDPGPGASFRTVIEVARVIREELDAANLHGALKTSGSSGLHVYLPLPARTPLESATLVAQILATRVATRRPEIATVERLTKKRPKGTVYVDYLQNILGKTVAGVYAVRAKPLATVSTPLAWSELTDDLDLRSFTLETVPTRVAERGEIWGPAMRRRNSLTTLLPRS